MKSPNNLNKLSSCFLKKADPLICKCKKAYSLVKKLHPAFFHAIPIILVLIFGIYISQTLQKEKESLVKADILMAQKELRKRLAEKKIRKEDKIEKLETVIEELKAAMRKLCPSNSTLVEKECVCKEGYGLSYDKKFCLNIPNNAYYVGSISDTWLCHDGYIEMNDRCVLMKKATTSTESQRRNSPSPPKKITTEERTKHYKQYLKSMSIWIRFLESGEITQNEFDNYDRIAQDKYEKNTGESFMDIE